MALNTVTVTWTEEDSSLAGVGGTITFTLSTTLTDSTDSKVVRPVPQSYPVSQRRSVPLVANDNALASPTGSFYTITIQGTDGSYYSFQAVLNFANGAVQDLATLVPITTQPVMVSSLPLPTGTPAAGEAPIATGTGEASAWGGVVLTIGPASGTDDTAAINALLTTARTAGGGVVKGTPGQSYKLSAPLRIGSGTTLDMTGCTVTLLANSNNNAVQNWAVQANRRILDGVANGTTTFTSATAAFTSADATAPNNNIRIYYVDGTWQDTTIASVTNGTTVVLAAAATESGTGLFAVIGAGRDSNVRMIGGTHIRNSPNNPLSSNAHQLRFRHCDRLEVGPIGGTTLDGRYLVSVGDCATFSVHDISPTSTVSDTLHINGPAGPGWISRVTNPSPGDDVVAFTAGELAAYADVMGNIIDVTVDGVRVPVSPATSPNAVKILAGTSPGGNPYTVDRITVRDVKCAILNDYPVNICDDPSSGAYTVGGIWGKIVVEDVVNINPASTYPAVNVIGAQVTDLRATGVYSVSASAGSWLNIQAAGGGHPAAYVARLTTDCPQSRVKVVTGGKLATWFSESVPAENPASQPAALSFNGTSTVATAPDNAVLDITGSVSLELWLNPTPTQVAFWTAAGKSGQFWIEGSGSANSTQCQFFVQNGATSYGSALGTALQPGRLNHVVGTFDASTGNTTIYVNGVSHTTTNAISSVATTTNLFYLGNRQGFTRNVSGQMADVRVWNGLLSAAEVTNHFLRPGDLSAAAATLAARWKFDEGTGTTLNDSSGNGNTATLTSGAWVAPYSPYFTQPVLATGAAHTVDDVIAALQAIGLFVQ